MTPDQERFLEMPGYNQLAEGLQLTDVIDIESTRALMEELSQLTGFAFALGDMHGDILIATGWQDVCAKFHHLHPETRKNCHETDKVLTVELESGSFQMYKCKNHLWDIVTPIKIEGRHLGNLFMGQFFLEEDPLDWNLFKQIALKYGFDLNSYLTAIKKVPRLSRNTVDAVMRFYIKLAQVISTMGHKNLQLERTIAEYNLAQQKLNTSKEELYLKDNLLRRLSKHVPGVIFQFHLFPDNSYSMEYASEGIIDLFEITPEEAYGDNTIVLKRVAEEDQAELIKSILYSFHKLQPWEFSFRVNLPQKGQRWVKGSAAPEKLVDAGVLWHGFFTDITDLKLVEKEITDRNRELTSFYSLSVLMRTAKSTAELLPIVLGKAQSLLKADDGMVSLLSLDGKYFTIAFGSGHWQGSIGNTYLAEEGLSGIVLRTQKTYVSVNYCAEEMAVPLYRTAEVGPIVVVPLLSETELVGVLAVSRKLSESSVPFNYDEVRLLETIGELAGSALNRQRLYEDSQRRLRQTQALRNIDMAITGSLDLRVTYNVILDEITRQLNIDAAAILRLEHHSMTLKYEASRGIDSTELGRMRFRLGEGYAGRTAMNKQACHIPDLREVEPDSAQGRYLIDEGFCAYYAVPLIAKGQIQGVLEVLHRNKLDSNEEWLNFLDTLAGQTAIAIDSSALYQNLERANIQLVQSYDATIEGWAYALDLRDEATEGHSRRVAKMTLDLAIEMGVKDEDLAYIRRGALLHDIGKMGIPDSILLKPGKLNHQEWAIMHKHPEYAYQMLSSVDYLRPALDIPYCHHEKWDGSGYPRGIKGKEIPISARIFAVVDMYDALTSERPYRSAWAREDALTYIQEQRGKHFDPLVVDIFMNYIEKENS